MVAYFDVVVPKRSMYVQAKKVAAAATASAVDILSLVCVSSTMHICLFFGRRVLARLLCFVFLLGAIHKWGTTEFKRNKTYLNKLEKDSVSNLSINKNLTFELHFHKSKTTFLIIKTSKHTKRK